MPNDAPRFRWYELMTTDAKAALDFYGQVVGWRAEPMTDTYTIVHPAGAAGAIGGVMSLSPQMQAGGARPVWMGYVGVPDVDDYAARLTKAGGTVHQPPSDIPGILRFAPVSDPQGAPFVIYRGVPPEGQPEGPPEGEPNEAGYVGWRELQSSDGAAAWAFYSGLFGWTETGVHDMGPMGKYRLWGAGGAELGGMMGQPGVEGPPPMWNFYFNVPSVEAATARLTAAGGQVVRGPMQVPGGNWVVTATDPQGAQFSLSGEK